MNNDIKFYDSQKAFQWAYDNGYKDIGEYMYMHSSYDGKIDYFKHILTRKYIEVKADLSGRE